MLRSELVEKLESRDSLEIQGTGLAGEVQYTGDGEKKNTRKIKN